MKVDGAKKLARQLQAMPAAVRSNLQKSVRLNTEQAANMARRLVPIKSGELKGWIHTQYEADGMTGSVEAAPPTKAAQIKAKAVEFGREKGERGKTAAQPYIRLAQKLQKPKFQRSMRSAVRRGMKEATSG
ncbi:MAG: hypothetical protein EBT13_13320 [Rhodobacteraceae bacterium]|jgi:hypothetical protein|nr:hypothetical protein [Paracoccaceae bacterium]